MRAIDLRKTPTYVISGDQRRIRHIHAVLERVGITPTLVRGIRCSPGIIGCALSHLKVLDEAPEPPFLVLEDDCSVTEAFRPVLHIPAEAQAVYLGVSTWGIVPNHHLGVAGAARATVVDECWLRIHNMLSAHAILYMTADYVTLAYHAIVQHLTWDIPFDIGFAILQRDFTVLTPREPFFYQDARVGGAEEATRRGFALIEIKPVVSGS